MNDFFEFVKCELISGNIVLSWVGLSGGATDPGTINSYLIYYDFNNGDPFTSNWTGTGATQVCCSHKFCFCILHNPISNHT
jgi:hypothetical protein